MRRGPKPSWISEAARAAAHYKRQHRTHLEGDLLLAHCWCDQRVVVVPAAEVRAGSTRSCGGPWCDKSILNKIVVR